MRSFAISSLVAIAMAFEAPPHVADQVGAILGIYAMCGNDPIDCGQGWCCLNGQQCVTDPTGNIMCYDPGLSQANKYDTYFIPLKSLLTLLREPITVDPAYFGTIYSYQATPSIASNYASYTPSMSSPAGHGPTTILVAASGASSAASAASAASKAAGSGAGTATYAAPSSEHTTYGETGVNSTHGATNVSNSGSLVMSNIGSSTTTSSNIQISIVALIGFFVAALASL